MYKDFLIVMDDEDTFVVAVKQDINRPNNPDNDELVADYMNDNYPNQSYKSIAVESIALLDVKVI